MRIFRPILLCSLMVSLSAPSISVAKPPAKTKQIIKIAYFSQERVVPAALSNLDPFIQNKGVMGAKIALEENNTTGKFTGQQYQLTKIIVPIKGDIKKAFLNHIPADINFVVVNLPVVKLKQLADLDAAQQKLLFDVTTRDDGLRGQQCRANVLHLQPSRAMRADALAQFMLKKRWKKWFLVTGSLDSDRLYGEAFKRAAKKFGLKIVAEKKWAHTYDARRTAQSDIPVFTQDIKDYDVLVVADEHGSFGEYLSYRTWLPRPIIGTQGLIATSWHLSHEQWGAVQMQNRFKEMAKRTMKEEDYGAYLAVKAIGEASVRTKTNQFIPIKNYLLSDQLVLQGYKGKSLSFRKWNGQLRQPILLAAPRSLVSVAPVEGFLHPKTELDTLGYDAPEARCEKKQ
ncbi:MAG: ABC transporter substrate-binding protein [Methylococcales bacterium]|nr:ABC transporter substrate-binding protein [Methylococcales bacterium]MCK5925389.1 ABC transporter substrate-binding protein [Methylococcales bacterium]